MTTLKEKAPFAVTTEASNEQAGKCKLRRTINKPPCKIHRILSALVRGESLNFIEAQQRHHDRTLHSTISEIQQDYGITVSREWEIVPGYMNEKTRCRRYFLEPDQMEKAKAVLP